MAENKRKWISPFESRINAPAQKDFDKYYLDVTEREVFKETGELDPDTGDKLGVSETKLIIKKIDISEYLESQSDLVGIEHYIKQLALQGVDINELNTVVDESKVDDFTHVPDNLADLALAGDKARAAFDNLDPALKGGHTTIEGFLNSLSPEVLQNYIKSKVEGTLGSSEKKVQGGD